MPDEVVIELPNSVSAQQIEALQRRHRLTRLESQAFQLSGTTLYRWRIPDRRSVATVVRELETDRLVAWAQPNYLFMLQQNETRTAGDARNMGSPNCVLPQAHALAKGDNVLVAVIDSGIDGNHPELAGSIAGTFDALSAPVDPAPARNGDRQPDRSARQADGIGAGRKNPRGARLRSERRRRAKAPRSIFSSRSTGRRRRVRA